MFKDELENYQLIPCIFFPMKKMDRRKSINEYVPTKVKIKGIKEFKRFMKVYPTNAPFGIFGLDTIKVLPSKAVVVTEGEYDSMSVY